MAPAFRFIQLPDFLSHCHSMHCRLDGAIIGDGSIAIKSAPEHIFVKVSLYHLDKPKKICYTLTTLGYSQVVRQRTLTPSFAGSNPATPTIGVSAGKRTPFWSAF